ncbi:MAG: adenine phosphoribosyltransferase [Gammaproteobacteria bacterium]|nr:adenine phosphoribosyltransferase [Gammaproteobacteria bacterium]
MNHEALAAHIRAVPDFPRPGILFRDITPLLASPPAFTAATAALAERILVHRPSALVAIESRGFLFGAALAQRLGLPLLLVRKPGKLPSATTAIEYQLEYGSDRLEIHVDAVQSGSRCAIIDDVLATGGTAAATAELVRSRGGEVACLAFLLELDALGGRNRLGAATVESLLHF